MLGWYRASASGWRARPRPTPGRSARRPSPAAIRRPAMPSSRAGWCARWLRAPCTCATSRQPVARSAASSHWSTPMARPSSVCTASSWRSASNRSGSRPPATGTPTDCATAPNREAVRERQPLVCELHRGLTRGMLDLLDPKTKLVGVVPNDPDAAGCLIELRGNMDAEAAQVEDPDPLVIGRRQPRHPAALRLVDRVGDDLRPRATGFRADAHAPHDVLGHVEEPWGRDSIWHRRAGLLRPHCSRCARS
jgi:hypothetical protein